MKLLRTILSSAGIGALSLAAAGLTWLFVGPPDRSVFCNEDELEPGHVCLETVRSWERGSHLWIDARPRELWEKNGVSGSVLLTDDNNEDYDLLFEGFMNAIFNGGDIFPHVVIYCNEAGCGSSKAIAEKLRNEVADELGFKVHILHGGWKALADAEMILD
ncbi:MAG: rhodanese-like domain-containing protein [Akkermansiaceae bacterium]